MPRPLAQCRGCQAAVVWIHMRDSGKAMICDPEVLTEWLRETAGGGGRAAARPTSGGCPIGSRAPRPTRSDDRRQDHGDDDNIPSTVLGHIPRRKEGGVYRNH